MTAAAKKPASSESSTPNSEAQVVQMPLPPAAAPKKKRNGRRLALMVSVPVVLLVGGGYFWLTGGRYIDTDNAYVQQSMVSISSDVSGRITAVPVHENQTVSAGDVLFEIDATPYRIALEQAEAALASARVNVDQLHVAYDTANAKLQSAQNALDLRQAEFNRTNDLVEKGVSSQSSLDDVKLALQSAQSAVDLARQEVANAAAALGGDPEASPEEHPAIRAAIAARDNAQRNLDKTTVVSPGDGIVSQVASLNVGQFVSPGTTIASLVETADTWIEANFKETQLSGIIDGLPAEVSVDAYPGLKLHGTVDSIGAATGAEFALIPAQNATGNWVKVVQRVPVRIRISDADLSMLRAGMSATVSVDGGKTTLDTLLAK